MPEVEVTSVVVTTDVVDVNTGIVDVADAKQLSITIADTGVQGPPGATGASGAGSTYNAVQFTAANNTSVTIGASGFNPVPVGVSQVNVGGGVWDETLYTVPATGRYLITARLRIVDSSPARSCGIGVHTSNADGAWFTWREFSGTGNASRDTFVYTRIDSFTQGSQLRLYVYSEGATFPVIAAALTIDRIG